MRQVPNKDGRLRVVTLARNAGSGYGGAEKVAYEFARRLDPGRFRSWLCTTWMVTPDRVQSVAADRRELAAAGIDAMALERRSHISVLPWQRLFRLLARERIDVLHAHMPRASVPGAILARAARVPVVISHEHGSVLEGKRLRPLLDRLVVGPLSTRILAVSEYDRQQMIVRERISPDRVAVLPNGIPPLPRSTHDVRAELGIPADRVLVGAIGRLYDPKGYDYLIPAVAELRRRGHDPICIIVGDGPDEAQLQAQIDELDLRAHVRLIGRRGDIPDVIAALDIAVLPSRWEGFPLAVLEYMAGGAPIVATAVGGVPEMIEDGRHGLLVPPRDPVALAGAIERLIDDRDLARRLGDAARERQQKWYDLDEVVERLESLYVELHEQASRIS